MIAFVNATSIPTILVIEDEPSFIYLMQRYAAKSGWRIVVASEGREALRLVQEERPTVIMLDIALPGMDGWQVLEALKADHSTRDIPVVMCSGLEEVRRSLHRGAVGYLQKPVLYQDFVQAVTSAGISPRYN